MMMTKTCDAQVVLKQSSYMALLYEPSRRVRAPALAGMPYLISAPRHVVGPNHGHEASPHVREHHSGPGCALAAARRAPCAR